MKKRKISLPVLLGICLIVFSLFLVLFFQVRMQIGSRNSRLAVDKLVEMMPPKKPGIPESYTNSTMPVLEIDGVDYVAILEIPSFDVTVPVADQWDSGKLSHSPARFCGSSYDRTLVIGGTDTAGQFAFCDKIELGAPVTVTDVTGAQFSYTVSGIDRSDNAETRWLTDADCDLTLFCRDMYSMEYIAVRCVSYYS